MIGEMIFNLSLQSRLWREKQSRVQRLLYCSFAIFFMCVNAHAQTVSLSASIDKNKLSLNDQLILKISVSGDVNNLPEPTLPQMAGFTAYSSGRNQSVSFVNGAVSSSIEFSYVLTPRSAGQFTIGPITLHYQDKSYTTNPISVEVTQGQQQPASQPQSTQPGQQAAPQGSKGKDLMVTLTADKSTAYVGEQVTMTMKFFIGINLLAAPRGGFSSTPGFVTEDLGPQKNYRINLENRQYDVSELKQAIIPTQSGKRTVTPAQVQCVVQDNPSNPDDFFRSFLGGGKTIVVKSEPVTLTILPLPSEGRSAAFNGAVGNYTISAKVDKTEGKMNEPITLEITVSGTGNIKSIGEPQLGSLPGFRKYDTLSSLNITKNDYKIQGSKVFKTIVIPKVTGKVTIPQISYSYFNPASKSYQNIETSQISLNILPGPKEEQRLPPVATQEGIKFIGTDIRHIKSAPLRIVSGGNKLLIKNPLFVSMQFAPLLFFGAAVFYKTKKEKLTKDRKYARFTLAYKKAKKNLLKAKNLIGRDAKEFYGAVAAIFTDYVADKLNLSSAGLTWNALSDEMNERGINQELISQVNEMWQEFDFLRFAPAAQSDTASKEAMFQKTDDFINTFEKIL